MELSHHKLDECNSNTISASKIFPFSIATLKLCSYQKILNSNQHISYLGIFFFLRLAEWFKTSECFVLPVVNKTLLVLLWKL